MAAFRLGLDGRSILVAMADEIGYSELSVDCVTLVRGQRYSLHPWVYMCNCRHFLHTQRII